MPLLPSAHTETTVYAIAEKVKLSPYAWNGSNVSETSAVTLVLTGFSHTGSGLFYSKILDGRGQRRIT